jgi:hypothetical protein
LKRTTQGGPPSGDRKYGTGGDLALFRQRNQLSRKMAENNWEVIAGYVRWTQPGSRAVGCERGAPLRRSDDEAGVCA